MSIKASLTTLMTTVGVAWEQPMAPAEVADRLRRLGWALPEPHRELLTNVNGITAFGGYFRIFGLGKEPMTLEGWNSPKTWKFAWPRHLGEYLCFAEDAWGDQYAYRLDELNRKDPPVYWLESLMLEPEPWEPNFAAFLANDFLRNAVTPWDSNMLLARKRLGALRLDEHLVYSPSPLLTDETDPESIMKMPASAAMILNGDLARQLGDETFDRGVSHVEPYTDPEGRMRLNVVWA